MTAPAPMAARLAFFARTPRASIGDIGARGQAPERDGEQQRRGLRSSQKRRKHRRALRQIYNLIALERARVPRRRFQFGALARITSGRNNRTG
jgi:hypothetical protein